MSDSTQQWILKQPIEYICLDCRDDEIIFGEYDHWQGSVKRQYFDEVFVPLDIPAIEKQLEGHLASFIVNVTEYVDLCDHAQNAEELNAIRGHFNRCQHEHIAQVLRLFGLENKENDDE